MDPTKATDDDLALAVKAGSVDAFDELVRRHQGRVFAVAYRIMSNREDALDVAQDAFVKAFRKVSMWEPTTGFVPWLMRLTANQAIDSLRKRKRRTHEPIDEMQFEQIDGDPARGVSGHAALDTERQVRAKEIDERIRQALETLSPAQRAVFVLRHYEGLQLAEIADVQGCTVGSVKVHLFRALKKMQVVLEDLHAP